MSGTLMTNTAPHQKWSSTTPPRTGPSPTASPPTPLKIPITMVRCLGSVNALRSSDSEDGMIVAPATPSSARAAMSGSALEA
jgi:hypothetical protein